MKSFVFATFLISAVVNVSTAENCDYGGNILPGEFISGTTTRYWDCCKMSCSWDKGIPFVNQPVKSCNADGFTEGLSYDKSICESGGFSGSCNDFQPWWDPAHPDLLFMFAAFQNGDNDCCSCAELKDFSDPNLAGKTVILQITNCGTGAELGVGHFDLQMPMSGVGYWSQGCANQWGSGINFGQQYGGIYSEQECHQLYDAGNPLYLGCLFRFRSFLGSDNPSMKYRRVQCPEVLTKLSKCTRTDDQCFPALEMPLPSQRMPYVDTDYHPLPNYPSEGSSPTTPPSGSSTSSTTKPSIPTQSTSPSTSTMKTTTHSTSKPIGGGPSDPCFTELNHFPLSPLYCQECPVPPTPNAGPYVCNAAGNYAPCFPTPETCFEGLRGEASPSPVLTAAECITAPSYWPTSESDCLPCPANPFVSEPNQWSCVEFNHAPCFESPAACYAHFRDNE